MKARFPIGTQYQRTYGKRKDLCTVEDIYYTYNLADDLVKIEYVTSHLFCGQIVMEYGVCDATIARNLIAPDCIANYI